jgi:hypothetical protein
VGRAERGERSHRLLVQGSDFLKLIDGAWECDVMTLPPRLFNHHLRCKTQPLLSQLFPCSECSPRACLGKLIVCSSLQWLKRRRFSRLLFALLNESEAPTVPDPSLRPRRVRHILLYIYYVLCITRQRYCLSFPTVCLSRACLGELITHTHIYIKWTKKHRVVS